MATLVPLIGVSYTLAVYLIALCTLLALFARNRRALALPLLVCMLDWIVSSASVLPFLLYIISQWEGDGKRMKKMCVSDKLLGSSKGMKSMLFMILYYVVCYERFFCRLRV